MGRAMRLDLGLVTCLAAFSGLTDAFWRLPCRGRSGLARMDPLMDPGSPSYHVHAIHGSKSFSMGADAATLKEGSCTSCGVKQDHSAYWSPALYFQHENGDTELVDEVGGMLAYYLLYGENVTAFPEGFRMISGDTFKRDFPWPVPDPPKSEWTGDQGSQKALAQKAIGFNCLNYDLPAEPSLGRHFLPNKTYLDEHCKDGVRFEVMFPSCWNGKDVDSEDHQSHVAFPSLVMDGTCPEGYETRLVSLFFETIWNTYAFKDKEGHFVLANGDPTGYGYHGDFMHGWDQDVLEKAVDQCTNPSGEVSDCPIFELQGELEQTMCNFDLPDILKEEEVKYHKNGLPNEVMVEWGPAYASPVKYNTPTASSTEAPGIAVSASVAGVSASASIGLDLGGLAGAAGQFLQMSSSSSAEVSSTATPTPTPQSTATPETSSSTVTPESTSTPTPSMTTESSTSTPTPTPTTIMTPSASTSILEGPVTQEVVWVEQNVVIIVDEEGNTIGTEKTGDLKTMSTALTTSTRAYSTDVETVTQPAATEYQLPPAKRDVHHHRRHRHAHGHHAH